jgi:drug/metabolite transporter (DMT)-like permease
VPAVLALLAAVIWGSTDFAGGSAAKRLGSAAVLLLSTTLALPVLVVVTVLSGDLRADDGVVGWGVLAGISGSLGITCLYQGLATGVMGVVAPISGTAVIVPVVVGVASGDELSALQAVALVVAIVGIVLTGGPQVRAFRSGGHRPVLWALAAAVLLGFTFVSLAEGASTSAATTITVQRAVYVLVTAAVVVLARQVARPTRTEMLPLAVIGAGDLTANALFALASREGELAVVAVLASLYPVTTVLLARRLQHERLQRLQVIGVIAAVLGVAGVVAG